MSGMSGALGRCIHQVPQRAVLVLYQFIAYSSTSRVGLIFRSADSRSAGENILQSSTTSSSILVGAEDFSFLEVHRPDSRIHTREKLE